MVCHDIQNISWISKAISCSMILSFGSVASTHGSWWSKNSSQYLTINWGSVETTHSWNLPSDYRFVGCDKYTDPITYFLYSELYGVSTPSLTFWRSHRKTWSTILTSFQIFDFCSLFFDSPYVIFTIALLKLPIDYLNFSQQE